MNLWGENRNLRWLLLASVCLFLIGFLAEKGLLLNSNDVMNQRDGKELKVFLEEKIEFLNDKLMSHDLESSFYLNEDFKDDLDKELVKYSYFNESREVDWVDQSFDFDRYSRDSAVSLRLFENGWYIMGFRERGGEKLVLYYQLFFKKFKQKESFRFEFNNDVPVNREMEFRPKPHEEGSFELGYVNGKLLKGRFMDTPKRLYVLWFYLGFAILFLAFLVLRNFRENNFNSWSFVKQYFSFMLIIRVMYYFSFAFTELRNTMFFSPEVFASNLLSSSIGDITLDILIWLPIVFYLNHEHNLIVIKVRKYFENKALLGEIILHVLLIFMSVMVSEFAKSLILDSKISFNLNEAGSITFYSYVGIFLLMLIVIGMVVFSSSLIRMMGMLKDMRIKLILLISFITILTIIIASKSSIILWASLMCYVFLYIFMRFFNFRYKTLKPLIYVLFFNLLFTVIISYFVDYKEKELRKIFALKALFGYDLEAEDHLLNVDNKIENDKIMQEYFTCFDVPKSEIEQRLKQLYFSGYLNKYDLELGDFHPNGRSYSRKNSKRFSFYNDLYDAAGREIGINFKALNSSQKYGEYIGVVDYYTDSTLNGKLFIVLKAKAKLRESTFFSSLSTSSWIADELKGYSYAVYEYGKVVKSFGEYNYPVVSVFGDHLGQKFETSDDYSHLVYSEDGITQIVVSNPTMSMSEWISIFLVLVLDVVLFISGILFILWSLLLLAKRLDHRPIFNNIKRSLLKILPILETRNYYLVTKLHLSMFGIIMLIFAVTLIITLRFVSTNYFGRQTTVLKEKMYRVVKSIETSPDKLNYWDVNNSDIYKLSYERGLDINLYDSLGKLVVASNNRIFEEGLIGPKLDKEVFSFFKETKKQEFQDNEQIGELNYLSAYYAMYDEDDKLLGFVNIPYFAQSSDLEREISNYVVNLINLYGIVLIIAFVVAYVLSQRLSKPLTLIRQYMGEVKLGVKNKEIIWKNKDEIGLLVERYNEMLKEIEANAQILASSEREGAWREMAKQVAHEIKNPLTPMKLQVQMLRKSWMTKQDDIDERFDRVTSLLLDRIDALSEMARQFSSFSQLPKVKIEKVNLREILQDMVDFHEGDDRLAIKFNETKDIYVAVDKEQLIRVFTNLIQNARQSISEGQDGVLIIKLEDRMGRIIISFSDNGSGISRDLFGKIFEPNFSTKNSGMGLGLAICRKIIQSFNGEITFTSQINKGSTFFVNLPETD
jgi:two-component system nitrogen regulation sensor histidine kinase NtrY